MATCGTKHESSRLRHKESDWKLVGAGDIASNITRTRGGGKRKQPPIQSSSSSSSDDEWQEVPRGDEDDEEDEEDERHQLLLKSEKPPHQRVILEVQHVEDAFNEFCKCPE
jgi:hypothetical protein